MPPCAKNQTADLRKSQDSRGHIATKKDFAVRLRYWCGKLIFIKGRLLIFHFKQILDSVQLGEYVIFSEIRKYICKGCHRCLKLYVFINT